MILIHSHNSYSFKRYLRFAKNRGMGSMGVMGVMYFGPTKV